MRYHAALRAESSVSNGGEVLLQGDVCRCTSWAGQMCRPADSDRLSVSDDAEGQQQRAFSDTGLARVASSPANS